MAELTSTKYERYWKLIVKLIAEIAKDRKDLEALDFDVDEIENSLVSIEMLLHEIKEWV